MKIERLQKDNLGQITDLAYDTYQMELAQIPQLKVCTKAELAAYIVDSLEQPNGVIAMEDERVIGFLLCQSSWEGEGCRHYYFPFWGYGAVKQDREKILSKLFEEFAKEENGTQKVQYEMKFYAHDQEAIRLFSFLQFGIECEEGIRSVTEKIQGGDYSKESNLVSSEDKIRFRELSKEEMKERWSEVWNLLTQLIGHLQKSPVFYPGTEFTEQVYRDYLLDPNTRLFAAEQEARLLGIIDSNCDGNSFLTKDQNCYNVGDVFVVPEYRGDKVAQKLLQFASNTLQQEGVQQLWVEHGTANPNARGFWNKYFKTYSYTMIRTIGE